MIGLTRYDDNQVINEYKVQFGVTNPCAGQEGGAGDAIDIIIEGQPFFGAPTYCVVCPDKKLHFNVCFPPTPECFDDFIISCGATSVDDPDTESSNVSVYPNPATSSFRIQSNKEISKVVIYDLLGSKVFEDNVFNQTDVAIDIRDLQPGIYLVEINTSEGIITQKLAVE
jgi:hypothetical protein